MRREEMYQNDNDEREEKRGEEMYQNDNDEREEKRRDVST